MGFKRPLVQLQSLGPKNSRHSVAAVFFVQAIGTSGLLQIQIRRSACRTQSVGMPLVQLQSLGPIII